ncbi:MULTISPECIES: pseudouridine synthase [Clostridia]|jgi:16S rRNA pseudouridine516 synthase|uniref:Pseudouridine synthase n=1 Tax=Butyribacter intestini TaxID=1703332 RepID=A0AAW3JTW9_9FIRM|nr:MULTISPECIES: pseudouridine synthase [Clostridia]KQC86008.1 16S rRNA pseudouridine(516) synthase [Butyribacter intestini]RHP25714.1 rRNA pseudouridine synthase [Clostridium sp. AF34-13]RHU77112.1 rRNA pseudouridine synthase [Butyribacter intestini]
MIRLDKFLSEMSGWTRSEVKKIVRTGSVTVDGNEVKKPETKIDEKLSIVRVDGRQIKYNKYEYYMLNKPKGFVSATTDREHKTVVDIISSSEKKDLFPVGRLDIDTEGLLLITNDGELAHRLLAPKNHVEKTYYVEVSGILDDADVDAVEKGLDIGEEKNTIPAKMEILKTDIQNNISSCYLTIHEGKFHQVKRMMKKLGKTVTYLKRVSMGSLILDSKLKKGNYRKLTEQEIIELKK